MTKLIKVNVFFSIDFVFIDDYERLVLNYKLLKDTRSFLYGNYRNIVYYVENFKQVSDVVKNLQLSFVSIAVTHLEIIDIAIPVNLVHTNLFLDITKLEDSYSILNLCRRMLVSPFILIKHLQSLFFFNRLGFFFHLSFMLESCYLHNSIKLFNIV